jgi:hypothetical protein
VGDYNKIGKELMPANRLDEAGCENHSKTNPNYTHTHSNNDLPPNSNLINQ